MSFDEFFKHTNRRLDELLERVKVPPRDFSGSQGTELRRILHVERVSVFFSADVYTKDIEGTPYRWEVLTATFQYPANIVGVFMTEDIYDAARAAHGMAPSVMIPETAKQPTSNVIEGLRIYMDVASSFQVLCRPHAKQPQTRGHLLVDKLRG